MCVECVCVCVECVCVCVECVCVCVECVWSVCVCVWSVCVCVECVCVWSVCVCVCVCGVWSVECVCGVCVWSVCVWRECESLWGSCMPHTPQTPSALRPFPNTRVFCSQFIQRTNIHKHAQNIHKTYTRHTHINTHINPHPTHKNVAHSSRNINNVSLNRVHRVEEGAVSYTFVGGTASGNVFNVWGNDDDQC